MSDEESVPSTLDTTITQTTTRERNSAERAVLLKHSSPPINFLWQFAEDEWGYDGIKRLQEYFVRSSLTDKSGQERNVNLLTSKTHEHPPINNQRIFLKAGHPDFKGRSLYIPVNFIPNPETHSARIAMDPVELCKDSPYFDNQVDLVTIVTTALEFAALAQTSINQAVTNPGDARWRNPEKIPPSLSLTANKGQVTLESFSAALNQVTQGHFKLQAQAESTTVVQRIRQAALGPKWIDLS